MRRFIGHRAGAVAVLAARRRSGLPCPTAPCLGRCPSLRHAAVSSGVGAVSSWPPVPLAALPRQPTRFPGSLDVWFAASRFNFARSRSCASATVRRRPRSLCRGSAASAGMVMSASRPTSDRPVCLQLRAHRRADLGATLPVASCGHVRTADSPMHFAPRSAVRPSLTCRTYAHASHLRIAHLLQNHAISSTESPIHICTALAAEIRCQMVAEIARVVAGAVDQRRLAAAQELHPHQVHAGSAATPPS